MDLAKIVNANKPQTVVSYSDIPSTQYSEFKYIHHSKMLSTFHKIAAVKFQKTACNRLERRRNCLHGCKTNNTLLTGPHVQ